MLASLTFNFLIFIEAIDSCPAILRGKIKLKSFKSYEALKYDFFHLLLSIVKRSPTLCVYVSLCIHAWICISVCIYIYMSISLYMYIFISMYVCLYMSLCVDEYVYVSLCVYGYIWISLSPSWKGNPFLAKNSAKGLWLLPAEHAWSPSSIPSST